MIAKRQGVCTLSYMLTGGCFVQTCSNTRAVFGRTNNTLGGTFSYILPLFSTLQYIRLLYWRDASDNTLDYCIGGMHLTIH